MTVETAIFPSLYPLLEDLALKCESALAFPLDSPDPVIPTPHELSADPDRLETLYACGVIGEQNLLKSQGAVAYTNACMLMGIANACREAMRDMDDQPVLVTKERSDHAKHLWPLVMSKPGYGEGIRALSVIMVNSNPAVRAIYANRIRRSFELTPLQEASLKALVIN